MDGTGGRERVEGTVVVCSALDRHCAALQLHTHLRAAVPPHHCINGPMPLGNDGQAVKHDSVLLTGPPEGGGQEKEKTV